MQTIYLDISNKGVIPCIQAKQNEVGRKFLAVITDSGIPCEIKSDSVISVWYEGASGKGNYTDVGNKSAISVTKNRITVELIAQMLAVPGNGVITVLVNSSNGDQIGLWNIDYCVEKNAGVESEKAEDYYTAFSEAAAKLAKSAEDINSAIKAKNATAAGLIYPLASANVPSGFLLCDGAEYSRTEYAELFESIGTAYGSGDGSTTFNVPNLQTRVPVGVGDGYELGATGGEEKHQLTVEELPSHSHYQPVANILDGSSAVQDAMVLYTSENKQTSFIGRLQGEATGGNQPYNNMQPYTVVNYIISTGEKVEFVVGGGGCRIDDNTIGADAWSSKNIVDRLCPPINESSNAVRCVPIKDYPLDVRIYGYVEEATHARLTMRGKNLFDCTKYTFAEGQYVKSDGNLTAYKDDSAYACCKTFIPVSHLQGQQITINHPPTEIGGTNPKMVFYRTEEVSSVIADSHTNGYTATVPTDANFMRFSIPKKYSDGKSIQIELGGTVTSHERYRESHAIIAGYDWEAGEVGHTMNARGGTYTFTADVGTVDEAGDFVAEGMAEVVVSGRADPNATIRRLTDDVAELKAAILAMGANV